MEIIVLLDQYRTILQTISDRCRDIQAKHPVIPCKKGCTVCCEQLFPVSFIEAYTLSQASSRLPDKTKQRLKDKARIVKEKLASIPRSEFEGMNLTIDQIIERQNRLTALLNEIGINCTLLDESGACMLYDNRLYDCRIHGFSIDPQSGVVNACDTFTDVVVDEVQDALFDQDWLYPEKRKLDKQLLKAVTGGLIPFNTFYYTTFTEPFLKDYAGVDWTKFFTEKTGKKTFDDSENMIVLDF